MVVTGSAYNKNLHKLRSKERERTTDLCTAIKLKSTLTTDLRSPIIPRKTNELKWLEVNGREQQ